jgi:hypothetical protein
MHYARGYFIFLSHVLFFQAPLNHPIRFALGFGRPLIIELLPARQSKLDFGEAVFQMHVERNQGQPFDLGNTQQFVNLTLVHEQFAGAGRVDVEAVAFVEGADMHANDKNFPFVDPGITVFELHFALADRFNLRPGENDAGFELFFDMVIMKCLFIFGNDFG